MKTCIFRVKKIPVGTAVDRNYGSKLFFTKEKQEYCGQVLELFQHPIDQDIFVYHRQSFHVLFFHKDWLEVPLQQKTKAVKIKLFKGE